MNTAYTLRRANRLLVGQVRVRNSIGGVLVTVHVVPVIPIEVHRQDGVHPGPHAGAAVILRGPLSPVQLGHHDVVTAVARARVDQLAVKQSGLIVPISTTAPPLPIIALSLDRATRTHRCLAKSDSGLRAWFPELGRRMPACSALPASSSFCKHARVQNQAEDSSSTGISKGKGKGERIDANK